MKYRCHDTRGGDHGDGAGSLRGFQQCRGDPGDQNQRHAQPAGEMTDGFADTCCLDGAPKRPSRSGNEDDDGGCFKGRSHALPKGFQSHFSLMHQQMHSAGGRERHGDLLVSKKSQPCHPAHGFAFWVLTQATEGARPNQQNG